MQFTATETSVVATGMLPVYASFFSFSSDLFPVSFYDQNDTNNIVLVFLQTSTGYDNSQLVVPDNNRYQEDLSESSNSSSVDSSPGGMDPEHNNAWVEEETTPYAFSKFPPAVIPSGHAPQMAALQSSGADFFDGYFNGETKMQQPEMEEEVSDNDRFCLTFKMGDFARWQDKRFPMGDEVFGLRDQKCPLQSGFVKKSRLQDVWNRLK